MFDLTGKVALVTGSAQGIGRTSAEKLAGLGAKLICADINTEKLNDTVESIRQAGGEAVAVKLDLQSNESIEACARQGAEAFGGIDILVNCAGILGTSSIEDMKRDDEWRRVIDVNLTGTFFMCQYALPWLKQSHAGRIVNIGSISGRNGGFESSMSYTASKGGVIAITRGMARHLAPYKITVNAICPGTTETEMIKGYTQERIDHQASFMLLGRFARREEIAAAVCYLASDEAAFTTGEIMDVNGGAYFG